MISFACDYCGQQFRSMAEFRKHECPEADYVDKLEAVAEAAEEHMRQCDVITSGKHNNDPGFSTAPYIGSLNNLRRALRALKGDGNEKG